jgi:5-methylcytosine-specific restriction endonuclease McrA
MKTRSDRRYSDERAMFKGVARQNNTPCWLCGKPIDYAAPPQTPNAFELDHAQPLSTHPELAYEPTNFRASHSLCNRKRGNTHIPTSTRPTTWVKAVW